MNTFALDKNFQQINMEEISVDDLVVISGGSFGFGYPGTIGIPGPGPGDIPSYPGGGYPGGNPANNVYWGYIG